MLRTGTDALGLEAELARSRRVVVIAGGPIGLDVAAVARAAARTSPSVEAARQPLARLLHGDEVAGAIAISKREDGSPRVDAAHPRDGVELRLHRQRPLHGSREEPRERRWQDLLRLLRRLQRQAPDNAAVRMAVDPDTKRPVDRAMAVIGKTGSGKVLYFESKDTFARYGGRD